jgi:type VI secretion system protein ImpM
VVAPGSGDYARGDQLLGDALASPRGGLGALFEEPGGQYYAVSTFLTACLAERGKTLAKAGVTLDCPTRGQVGHAVWLELAQRLLRWDTAPSLLWTVGAPEGRLLITLGPATPSALSYWANPAHPGGRLWPLRTQKRPAIEAAEKALAPAHRAALDGAGDVRGLISALAS